MIGKFINKITCGDSYKLIKELPNKSVDLIVTDPPYGIKAGGVGRKNYKEQNGGIAERRDYVVKEWDNIRINKNVIDLMFSCSKEQIIFGGNYYSDILPPTKSWVIWDKITEAILPIWKRLGVVVGKVGFFIIYLMV